MQCNRVPILLRDELDRIVYALTFVHSILYPINARLEATFLLQYRPQSEHFAKCLISHAHRS